MSNIKVSLGDCVEALRTREGPLFDAVVTDPPYHLTSIVKRFGGKNAAAAKEGATGAYARASRGFMGQQWDGGDVAFRPETWAAIFDQMKPGAHLVAFSGTRTYHRMAVAIEDAGFEIRDMLAWTYGSGFPKSHNVANSIDKKMGHGPRGHRIATASRFHPDGTFEPNGEKLPAYKSRSLEGLAWEGYGSALKPALEPICLARKPLEGTIAENVLKWGTGGLNIDGCRVGDDITTTVRNGDSGGNGAFSRDERSFVRENPPGRFPANFLHDGSDEILASFPDTGISSGGKGEASRKTALNGLVYQGGYSGETSGQNAGGLGDEGSAARFFYSAKAGPLDRLGSEHATVKPVDLMRWLCRLVTPKGGLILDPFGGSGTTALAAMAEGFDAELIELMPYHVADIETKIAYLRGEGGRIMERHLARKSKRAKSGDMPLFG